MAQQLFRNNFDWQFIGPVTAGTHVGYENTIGRGVLQINDAASALLGTLTGGDWYVLTAYKRSGSVESAIEILKVLGVNEGAYAAPGECRIRVERGHEGTTPQTYVAGDLISMRLTAGGLNDLASDAELATKQDTLVSGSNIKTINSASLLGSGDVTLQPTLVSGTNIKTVGGVSLLGSGDVPIGAGDVVGPASSTDNALVRFDSTTGKLVQNSTATLSDTGELAGITSMNGGQLAGLKNKIINGKMEIAQRGTSFAAIAPTAYSLDRWQIGWGGSTVLTVSQQADVPSSNEFQYSLRAAVTTADTSIAPTDYAVFIHTIEGYNARDLIGKTFTLSFWVRSSKTGTHCVSLRNSGTDRSYITEYTINAVNTWEQKSVTVSGGLITAGTWDWTNGKGLQLIFAMATGSTFQAAAGTWQTGNFFATANQVNCLDTIGNIFAITGVQLEVGSVATPFEHRLIGMEIALCQRYYESGAHSFYINAHVAGSNYGSYVQFKAVKRAIPSITTTAPGLDTQSANGANFFWNSAAPGQHYFNTAWTASAEL